MRCCARCAEHLLADETCAKPLSTTLLASVALCLTSLIGGNAVPLSCSELDHDNSCLSCIVDLWAHHCHPDPYNDKDSLFHGAIWITLLSLSSFHLWAFTKNNNKDLWQTINGDGPRLFPADVSYTREWNKHRRETSSSMRTWYQRPSRI